MKSLGSTLVATFTLPMLFAGPLLAEESARKVRQLFVYKDDEGRQGQFVRVSAGAWMETNGKGEHFAYSEINSDPDSIELHDSGRNTDVRICPDCYEVRQGRSGKHGRSDWQAVHHGSWQSPANGDATQGTSPPASARPRSTAPPPVSDDAFQPTLSPHLAWTIKVAQQRVYTITESRLRNGTVDIDGAWHNDGAHTDYHQSRQTGTKFSYETVQAMLVSYDGDDVKLRDGSGNVKVFRPGALGPEDRKWLARCKKLKSKKTWTSADGRFTMEAWAVGYSEDKVRLRRPSGEVKDVAVSSLCAEDGAFITALKKSD